LPEINTIHHLIRYFDHTAPLYETHADSLMSLAVNSQSDTIPVTQIPVVFMFYELNHPD